MYARRSALFAATVAVAALAAPSALAESQAVTARIANEFAPARVAVRPGESVTFTNEGGEHNMVWNDGAPPLPGPRAVPPDQWPAGGAVRRFDRAGRYRYYCELHGDPTSEVGMVGYVYVNAAGAVPPTPGPLMINVAMFGTVPEGHMVRRAGARPGDKVMVSGSIGDAALGLKVRQGGLAQLPAAVRDHLSSRYELPLPRTELADAVREHASAAMDVSDGLVGDLAKLCRASGVSAEIEAAKVPLSDAARSTLGADPALRDAILTGGDDYEILCAVPAADAARLAAAVHPFGISFTEIGTFGAGEGVRVLDGAGKDLIFARGSFSHF